jgi:hypothetical protein
VINISDLKILQTIITAILIYSAAIIAVVSAADFEQENPPFFKDKLRCGLIFLFILAISSGIFYVGQDIKNNFVAKNDNKLEKIMGIVDSAGIVEENLDQRNLENKIFLKNSTDATLLIVGLMMAILLAGRIRSRS